MRTAQQYVLHGNYDQADRWAARLDASAPPRPGAGRYGVGEQLLAINQPQRALPYLEAAHRADPANASSRLSARTGALQGRPGQRRRAASRTRLQWRRRPAARGLRSRRGARTTGDDAAAAAAIARINPAPSENEDAWLRLGRLASEVRAPQVAERFFRHAAEMRPISAAVRQQLGLNLLVLGRFDEAAGELAEAVRLDPRDADSLSHLAYCELKLGRADDARGHALAALRINPDDALARQLAALR